MRERPILFSGEMVRAILDGRKSQTRRVVKISTAPDMYVEADRNAVGHWLLQSLVPYGQDYTLGDCPYGEVGDRLWVREAWGTVRMHEIGQHFFGGPRIPDRDQVVYRAGKLMGVPIPDTSPMQFRSEWRDDFQPERWRPSIHMPRTASRIALEITGVRVERIQSILFYDIRAEGVGCPVHDFPGGFCSSECPDLRAHWSQRWNALNEKRGYGWDANPWVWVIEFKRVEA